MGRVNPRRGENPDPDLGWLIDELDLVQRRLKVLEGPSGEMIANVIDALIEPVAVYRLDSPAVSSSTSVFSEVSTEVPDGYTRALVNVTASASLRSNEPVGSWALLTVSAGIDNVGANTGWGSVSGQMYGSATSTRAEVLTGLAPGDTVDVSAFVAFPSAYTLPRVSVAGSILFLR